MYDRCGRKPAERCAVKKALDLFKRLRHAEPDNVQPVGKPLYFVELGPPALCRACLLLLRDRLDQRDLANGKLESFAVNIEFEHAPVGEEDRACFVES